MSEETPKVEFALGKEVSGSAFQSNFARSFVSLRGDSKSLGNELLLHQPHDDVHEDDFDFRNNYCSLDLAALKPAGQPITRNYDEETRRLMQELQYLKLENQTLKKENESLRLEKSAIPGSNVEAIDSVCLQNQITTYEWQLQQINCDRDMCRSLLDQVCLYLERVRKAMQVLNSRQANGSKGFVCPHCGHAIKDTSCLVPRSRSVHAIPDGGGGARGCSSSPTPSMTASSSSVSGPEANSSPSSSSHSSVSSSSSSSSSSRSSNFARAKSVAQISPGASSSGNDSGHGSSPHWWPFPRKEKPSGSGTVPKPRKQQQQVNPAVSKSTHDVDKVLDNENFKMYRKPKAAKVNPNEVPPEKLAEEAYRLSRTINSVLSMREPVLARVNGTARNDPAPANTASTDYSPSEGPNAEAHSLLGNCSNSSTAASSSTLMDRTVGSEESSGTIVTETPCANSTMMPITTTTTTTSSTTTMRKNLDDNFALGKNDPAKEPLGCLVKTPAKPKAAQNRIFKLPVGAEMLAAAVTASSTPRNRPSKVLDHKELNLKSLRDWALNSGTTSPSSMTVSSRPQATASVCSADTESGFSSLSSFQEVGLPNANGNTRPGCHTEVGLPEVPVDKVVRHRRWSSTPAECQAIFKRHSGNFPPPGRNGAPESLSIWV